MSINVDNISVIGFEVAIRGMRNPLNSWDRSDTVSNTVVGENDLKLMKKLCASGSEHRKFLRMIHVSMDVTAPLYWWKEYDTYKIGTVANSCSTMHKIHDKELTLDDFSIEHLTSDSLELIKKTIEKINYYRTLYININVEKNKKRWWWQMIQLLPTCYNQKRTIDFNYECAYNMIKQRTGHKLDEWNEFINILNDLPYLRQIME